MSSTMPITTTLTMPFDATLTATVLEGGTFAKEFGIEYTIGTFVTYVGVVEVIARVGLNVGASASAKTVVTVSVPGEVRVKLLCTPFLSSLPPL